MSRIGTPLVSLTQQGKFLPRLIVIVQWGWILVTVAAAIFQLGGPKPVPATAPPDQFSSARAMVHVQMIARAPHPINSEENRRVREYLMAGGLS
jgi:hypothetical protein